MQDDLRKHAKRLGLPLSSEPRTKLRIDRLAALARKANMDPMKVATAYSGLVDQLPAFRASYAHPFPMEETFDYRVFVANQLFAAVADDERLSRPALRLSLELVSMHPDAGFPKFRHNAMMTKSNERRFLTRTLATFHGPTDTVRPVARWFETRGGDAIALDFGPRHPQPNADHVVWGFERSKGLKIRPENEAFWRRYADTWWAPGLRGVLTENSNNQPYEVVAYEVLLHPGWFEVPSALVDVPRFDSAAFWT